MKNKLYKIRKNTQGMAVLIIVLVLGSVILLLSITMGLGSITENQISLYQSQSTKTFISTDGCAEEALTQINTDNSYAGGSLTIDQTSCTISVSGVGISRTLDILATKDNYTKNIQIIISLTPVFSITTWEEINN